MAIQRDSNSKATSQWYFFSVENYNYIGVKKFHIVNLIKSYSAYQDGMKPCVMVEGSHEGWKKGGFDISYRKNSLRFRG